MVTYRSLMCRDALMIRAMLKNKMQSLCFLLCWSFLSGRSLAQTTDSPNATPAIQQRLSGWLNRIDRDAKQLLKSLPQPIPQNPADRKLVVSIDTPVLSTFFLQSMAGQTFDHRVFVAQLVLTNLTLETKTIEPSQIILEADGNRLKNGELDKSLQSRGVQIGSEMQLFTQIKPTAVKIPPGFTKSTWVVFGGLPRGQQVPQFKLIIEGSDQPIEFDITAWSVKSRYLISDKLGTFCQHG